MAQMRPPGRAAVVRGRDRPKSKRRSETEYFRIASTVGGEFAAGPCSNPDSQKASAIFASEQIVSRADYTPVKTR